MPSLSNDLNITSHKNPGGGGGGPPVNAPPPGNLKQWLAVEDYSEDT